ncbi:MAG TPA: PTS sugar transporter subunit IIA [Gemmatimonadales bacterium]|nr:PTS sugar transporter subunit IIA [Gemmatimonadales bacterium]
MRLGDFFEPRTIIIPLQGSTQEQVLSELVGCLGLDERSSETLVRVLGRREELGSTGVGRGIAIPHSRSLVLSRVRLAYGYAPEGVRWDALDGRPVYHFFMIVAPPIEVSNQYLPVLGRIATFAKEADVPERLARLRTPEEFFALLEEKGV